MATAEMLRYYGDLATACNVARHLQDRAMRDATFSRMPLLDTGRRRTP